MKNRGKRMNCGELIPTRIMKRINPVNPHQDSFILGIFALPLISRPKIFRDKVTIYSVETRLAARLASQALKPEAI
jgi:hypothetical protein